MTMQPVDPKEEARRLRVRNWAMLIVLLAFSILVFAIFMVKMSGP